MKCVWRLSSSKTQRIWSLCLDLCYVCNSINHKILNERTWWKLLWHVVDKYIHNLWQIKIVAESMLCFSVNNLQIPALNVYTICLVVFYFAINLYMWYEWTKCNVSNKSYDSLSLFYSLVFSRSVVENQTKEIVASSNNAHQTPTNFFSKTNSFFVLKPTDFNSFESCLFSAKNSKQMRSLPWYPKFSCHISFEFIWLHLHFPRMFMSHHHNFPFIIIYIFLSNAI